LGKVRGTARSLLQRGEPQKIYLALLANIRLIKNLATNKRTSLFGLVISDDSFYVSITEYLVKGKDNYTSSPSTN
jgi:hypothetical protein